MLVDEFHLDNQYATFSKKTSLTGREKEPESYI